MNIIKHFLRLRSRDRKRIVLQIDFICQRLLEDAATELLKSSESSTEKPKWLRPCPDAGRRRFC